MTRFEDLTAWKEARSLGFEPAVCFGHSLDLKLLDSDFCFLST